MKRLFLLALLLSGCAHASPVALTWTYPRFNAAPGCLAASDTLKDLSRCEIYARRAGRTDSVLVFSKICAGLEARDDSATVDQPKGSTDYWLYTYDAIGNQSCRSSVVTRLVAGKPLAALLR
jgi:hypothetical protein